MVVPQTGSTEETLKTKFTSEFGFGVPIVQGGMGGAAGPDLVAAVANAGGLGILPIWPKTTEAAKASIERTQELTNKAFAVNLRSDLEQTALIETAASYGVRLFNLFWGSPAKSIPAIDACEGRLIATIGDLIAAKEAIDLGAAALIAQGVEAGGHVLGETPRDELLAQIVVEDFGVPIIAAGGLARASDVSHVLLLGADAALLGTRFVVAEESIAHPDYKNAIISAQSGSTVRTTCFDGFWPNAPHRVIRNSTFQIWDEAGQPTEGHRPGEGDAVLTFPNGSSLPRYFVATPSVGMAGDIEASAMYAGEGLGAVQQIKPAAEIIAELVESL